MFKPKHSPITLSNSTEALPATFSLLTWNLQKTKFPHHANRSISDLLGIDDIHLLSLQEAAVQAQQNKFFGLPFLIAPNIERTNNLYGVVTASAFQQKTHHHCLTSSKELGFTTHKTAIISQHTLANQQTLTHINIHAINFVPHYIFKKELQLLWHKIEQLSGPLIISGDFNTWNKTRLTTLTTATQKLHLKMVDFPDSKPIKTLNRQPLDHIFYRGLTLDNAMALTVPHISDHNPLIATFSTPKNI